MPAKPGSFLMQRLSLVLLFAMSLGTLTIAAATLPPPAQIVAEEAL